MIRLAYQVNVLIDAADADRIEVKRRARVLIREAIMGSDLSVIDLEITAFKEGHMIIVGRLPDAGRGADNPEWD